MNSSRGLIVRIIKTGIKKGEVRSSVEPDTVATIIFSTLEGAVMMSKLERNPIHLTRVVAHLQSYIQTNLA
jgi:hypothetical protein